jgi:XRE family transcriptional regulator, regulator of sulfur utilization
MNELQRSDELRLLGRHIRQLRKQRRLTQEHLAERSGVHTQFVGAIERGKANPTLKVLTRVATALGVSLADLVDYEASSVDPKQIRKLLREAIKQAGDEELQLLYRIHRSL